MFKLIRRISKEIWQIAGEGGGGRQSAARSETRGQAAVLSGA